MDKLPSWEEVGRQTVRRANAERTLHQGSAGKEPQGSCIISSIEIKV
jgi:hypothetical protein